MRKTFGSILGLTVLIFICTSGLVEPVPKVFIWLIILQYNSPDIFLFGQLVAKYGTWIITYSFVGVLFNALGWFNGSAMKIVYFIISTILSFLLSWIIMVFEKYLWIIAIVVGGLLLLMVGALITMFIVNREKAQNVNGND